MNSSVTHPSLPEPNAEQQAVIDAGCDFLSCVVQATPGSGKSTVCLMTAKANPDKKFLLLTFNSALKTELRQKVLELNILNVDVESYHSFCVKHVDSSCCRDEGLVQMIYGKRFKALSKPYDYDGVFIDETQDMTLLYYLTVVMILKSNSNSNKDKVQLFFSGDKRQCIYEFKGSDSRFLTFADRLFEEFTSTEWKKIELTFTQRFGPLTCAFVNNVFFRGEQVCRPAPGLDLKGEVKPRFVVCDFEDEIRIYNIIVDLIERHGYSKIYIMAKSVKNRFKNEHISNIANALVNRYKVAVSFDEGSEESGGDNVDCRYGKIVISTDHKVKGGTQICAVKFIDTNKKSLSALEVPNEVFVGCTRHRLELVLLHDLKSPIPSYMDVEALRVHADVEGMEKLDVKEEKEIVVGEKKKIAIQKSVTNDIVSFIPTDVGMKIMSALNLKHVVNVNVGKAHHLRFKSTQAIRENDQEFHEPVSAINGIAIPAMLEAKVQKKCYILDKLLNNNRYKNNAILKAVKKGIEEGDESYLNIKYFLFIANLWQSYENKFDHLPKQIPFKFHNWIKQKDALKALSMLEACGLGEAGCVYEHPLSAHIETPFSDKIWNICGRLDAIAKDGTLVEIKCSSEFQTDHALQLLSYAWLVSKNKYNDSRISKCKKFKLFYVCTGESYEFEFDEIKIGSLFDEIMKAKDSGDKDDWHKNFTDEEFVEHCKNASKDVIGLVSPPPLELHL